MSCLKKGGVAAVITALAMTTTSVHAQELTLRVGLTDPLDTPYGEAMQEFERIIEEGSDGRIDVQLFPSAQLGAVPEQLENTRMGVQEMSLISPAYASQFFPAFNVLELPYLVVDWDQAQRMVNSEAFQTLTDDAGDAIGVRIVGNFPYGFRNVANSEHPVETLDDFQGLRLRTQSSPVHIAAFEALGASPVAIGWDETYQAVQTGVVDGLENANTVLIANRYPEIAPYVSITRHLFGMLLVAVNAEVYDDLSEEDRQLFDEAMEAAEQINIDRALEIDETALESLTELGAEINDVSPEQIAAMQEAVAPVLEEFAPQFEPYLSQLQAAAAGE